MPDNVRQTSMHFRLRQPVEMAATAALQPAAKAASLAL